MLEVVVGDEVLQSPENYFSKVFSYCPFIVGCSALQSGGINKEIFQQHCWNRSAYFAVECNTV